MNFLKLCSRSLKMDFMYRSMSETIASYETKMSDILRQRFPKATKIQVKDISGGCGAMYEIHVESIELKGLNTVRQHMIVNEALKSQIKDMHGLRIFTSLPNPSIM